MSHIMHHHARASFKVFVVSGALFLLVAGFITTVIRVGDSLILWRIAYVGSAGISQAFLAVGPLFSLFAIVTCMVYMVSLLTLGAKAKWMGQPDARRRLQDEIDHLDETFGRPMQIAGMTFFVWGLAVVFVLTPWALPLAAAHAQEGTRIALAQAVVGSTAQFYLGLVLTLTGISVALIETLAFLRWVMDPHRGQA